MVAWMERPRLRAALKERRENLAAHLDAPVILWSGESTARNYPANAYTFRASSHFLYFAGLPLERAAIRLVDGRLELFIDEGGPSDALWHGPTPGRDEIARLIGADAAYPLADLALKAVGALTIPTQEAGTRSRQGQLLERPLASACQLEAGDHALAEAIVTLRLTHDEAAQAELRQAASITVEAHKAGMAATRKVEREAQVRAAIEGTMLAHDVQCAYGSIVTVHGEVLHNEQYHHPLAAGDLLLVDAGAESELGWASDVTRTWPVSGRFSPTQRAIYDVVLAAHDACIAQARPGIEYRDLHLIAAHEMARGLVELGILRGDPEELVALDAHALFFPHGIGHLLGLDVHDMEDLGDLAGYAAGRERSGRFGLAYLRLDRTLAAGMLVTIEPGFYQVPALLNDPARRDKYRTIVDWERLGQFKDVRGIRIEDDVLITETGAEVLTADLPTSAAAIEQLVFETT